MSRNGICDRLERSAKKELSDIWFRSWRSEIDPSNCALHMSNPCAEAALPDNMDFFTRSYMSKIAVAYPETPEGESEGKIGVELPTPKDKTKARIGQLKDIGCDVSAVHEWEVNHIHAYCPRGAAVSLIKLIEKTRFCGEK